MGIVDRLKLNARANLNHILDKSQNPQKMLDQFLLEMQGSVREVKEAVAGAIVGVKKLEHELLASAGKISQWEERARLALRSSNEELARKALEQKGVYVENERICREELERQKATVEELKADLAELETKLDEIYRRRIDLIKQHTQPQEKVNEIPAVNHVDYQPVIDMSVFDEYDRMIDRVRTMEAQAEALAELAEMDKVEAELGKLGREAGIESELRTLKGEASV